MSDGQHLESDPHSISPTMTSAHESTAGDEPVSWNPGLRPDSHKRNTSVDDFFDRYPGATPEKARRIRQFTDDLDEEAIPGNENELTGTLEERLPAATEETTVDEEQGLEPVIEDEFQNGATTIESGLGSTDHEAAPADQPAGSATSQEPPEAHYEHQGESNELEDAIVESAAAPLMDDEEAEPTVQTVSRADTLTATLSEEAPRQFERSFTTNFTELPKDIAPNQPAVPVSEEWPPVGDDKTFAELLDGENAQEPASEDLANEDTLVEPEATEQDLNAAWAAALDDDDILEDSNELDPTSFFGDDDDGFLEDEPQAPEVQTRPSLPSSQSRTSAYAPTTTQPVARSQYAPSAPLIDSAHNRGAGTPSTGLYDLYAQGQPQQPPPTRPSAHTAQSFVDQPKSTYQSPYDLPMEVVKPRRRPQVTPSTSQQSNAVPPPRSSSFAASPSSQVLPGMPPPASVASLSPPNSSHGSATGSQLSGALSARPTPRSDASFFADLPMATKPRARPSGAYTPQSSAMSTPQLRPSQSFGPPSASAPLAPPQQPPTQNFGQPPPAVEGLGLRQPDKAPLFPDQITPPSTMQSQMSPPQGPAQTRYSPAPPGGAPSGTATRYSPAPSAMSAKSSNRYSASPSNAPPAQQSRTAQAFLPRTSSPLAVHGRPQSQGDLADGQRSISTQMSSSPGKTQDMPSLERRESSTSKYAPHAGFTGAGSQDLSTPFSPPRQRTQSPSEMRKPPHLAPTIQSQPVSAMRSTFSAVSAGQSSPRRGGHLSHRRQFSRELPFAMPSDERSADPLERWKGHPIFHWTAAGVVTSSFPKQTPFYASGVGGPTIKCTPGDLKIADAQTIYPMYEIDAKFPGPLTARSKGKKKDLMAWLASKIEALTQSFDAVRQNFELSDNERQTAEEKVILWKAMRIFLEHDGTLEGNPKIEEQVRQVLLPDLAQRAQMMELQSPVAAIPSTDAVDSTVLAQILQALQEGQREKAAWLAEEKRLWGHAMLIASTMGPDLFKQIVGSFVRNQVKSQSGSNFKSLAALYQVFAGSPDDCVDELVPPSARAGFQMISKTDGKGNVDAHSGLDQWKDTLALVHSNPTPGNSASLLALGKLLAGYGRIEAAHTCYLFARSLAKHAGNDDADAHFVLLGTDTTTGNVDLDSLMLTEIFEYATSLSAPSTSSHYIPHLQAFKLMHGQQLASYGHKAQAQAYCEHIDAAIRATTRPSGYYNQALAQELVSLNSYLSQTPHAGSAGKFFSRPAMDKVSSGVGSWLSKFVSGDEGEEGSGSSQAGEPAAFGPFGGVNGDSGPISRNTSTTDLYQHGAMSNAMQQAPSMPSRYTPLSATSSTGRYAPAGAAQMQSRPSFDGEMLQSLQAPSGMPSAEPIRSASSRYAPVSASHSPALLAVQSNALSRKASSQSLLSTGSYEPKPLLAEQDGYGYSAPSSAVPASAASYDQPAEISHSFDDPPPTQNSVPEEHYDPEAGDGPPSSYEPPNYEAPPYEAPTYQPYQPEAEDDEQPKPKKKSFMDDDDDDITSRAAALKAPPSATREPDPAIVAAAEADAARAKGHEKHGSQAGWFGGWFGKKDPNGAAPGPIKAKLGEESSFYFDKDLGKWVNKKGGADAATASAPTPPPPRAPANVGPASSVRASPAPPTSGPPSRQGTPATNGPTMPMKTGLGPVANGSMPPPARPASTRSTASSLDDLLAGPPGGKKGAAAKGKKKGGRYVDVMAK